MLCPQKLCRFYLIFLPIIAVYIFNTSSTAFSATQTIQSTIQISICGNDIKEGGEDCDNADLNNQTCTSLGYGGGPLTCDVACSFDATGCLAPTPAPTPTSVPAESASPTSAPTATPAPEAEPLIESEAALEPKPTTSLITKTADFIQTLIPTNQETTEETNNSMYASVFKDAFAQAASSFDLNKNGLLSANELKPFIEYWLAEKNRDATSDTCDINTDNACDIVDLSIVLHYTE